MSEHPASGLDDVVHQRVRLGIMAVTHKANRFRVRLPARTLDLTAGNMNQHLGVLDKAGLIDVEKGYQGRRPRTWISLTKAGSERRCAPNSRP